mgnify:CR=1 FL=1
MLAGLSVVVCVWQDVEARDLFAPKEQATTEADPTQSPSFDEQKNGYPAIAFTWIKMAKGYEIEWDTFGRKGWYTQDPRLKPIEPGSVFPRDIPAIYIVFESRPAGRSCPVQRSVVSGGGEGRPLIRSARQRHLRSAGA